MSFDLAKLFVIVVGSLIVGAVAFMAAKGWAQRLMLLGLLGGLFFYSGIGGADESVSWTYSVYYFGVFFGVVFGFSFGRVFFMSTGRTLGARLPYVLGTMNSAAWQWVVVLYVLVSLLPLVLPEFRLHMLFLPPSPDLKALFAERFSTATPNLLEKLVGYAQLLLSPFFYLALYHLRFRLKWVILIFAFLLYAGYVDKAYAGRGDVMMHVGMIVLALWVMRPWLRKRIMGVILLSLPLLFYGFYIYGRIRIGGGVEGVGITDGVFSILETEWGFPRMVGMSIIESEARVNLGAYFVWIVTLPIPKIITGGIEGARINYEISEIVLGSTRGTTGWYVVLPGLVSEAVYIYGKYFFWVHGLLIGFMAAFFARLTERVPQTSFLFFYLVLMFSYALNRGGISALLPLIMNQFLLFYLFLFYILIRRKKQIATHIL
ncbi:hypothetical protein HLV39_09815 [Marinobacter adhaerens]|uniref:Oligosaccharide repeat unit polymerase n=1 Tax=Marinobacter adhaerens TaxID=1033846 RepID=A0A851HS02_9GAMM|nr:hypothetical protein [Marinobacter adhaerens]NWN91783.1 hypothetical protein [Marinobacter adhaerens]